MNSDLQNYRNELKELISKGNEAFEKQLNYISAGALGLSILFIEHVVKDLSTTKCNVILIISPRLGA